MEETNYSDFIDKLDNLKDLYIKSREAIALLENYNKGKKSYLGPHNEFRNALDHIMRMVIAKDDIDEYHKLCTGAESHLLRAGYDAYELICINQIEYIKDILVQFTANDISTGFPDYYKDIRPSIVKVEQETARLRQSKNGGNGHLLDGFQYYFDEAEKLIEYVEKVDLHLPIITECAKSRLDAEYKAQKPSRLGFYVGLAGFIVAIISLLIAFLK